MVVRKCLAAGLVLLPLSMAVACGGDDSTPSMPVVGAEADASADAGDGASSARNIVDAAGDSSAADADATVPSYLLGGTVTGLFGAGLVLTDGLEDLSIGADGAFAFARGFATGTAFTVAVKTLPSGPAQTCEVDGGTGTVGTESVTSITVNCATDTFAVGGQVAGLTGAVVVQNNRGNDLTISANGTFAFSKPLPSGSGYSVTVKSQPTDPVELCTVAMGTGAGTVDRAAVTSIQISCTAAYTVSGNVSGYTGSGLTLQNNGGDDLALTAGGAFTFAAPVVAGQPYAVSVLSNPTTPVAETCLVNDGSGRSSAAVKTVRVDCAPASYASMATGGPSEVVWAIALDGSLWGWGQDIGFAVLGGTTEDVGTPVRVGLDNDWASIAGGAGFACGLRTGGSLWCWGVGNAGNLGDGNSSTVRQPERIGKQAWMSVSTGDETACGLQSDGSLWCWGDNFYGEVGDGTTTRRSSPVEIASGTTWEVVSVGKTYSCGVQAGGALFCWGDNGFGQLGDGTTADRTTPVQVGVVGAKWSHVAAGEAGTCGIQTDGSLWCWGDNGFGQLGDGTTISHSTPERVGASSSWSSVTVSAISACGLEGGGLLLCWGDNSRGELGDGATNTTVLRPERIGASTAWTAISMIGDDMDDSATFGLQGNALFSWGSNYADMLGTGTSMVSVSTPQRVP